MERALTRIILLLSLMLASCGQKESSDSSAISSEESTVSSQSESAIEKELVLTIEEEHIDTVWQNNESVEALKVLAESKLTLYLTPYGGFEAYANLGTTLPSNDVEMTMIGGDIALYNSNSGW